MIFFDIRCLTNYFFDDNFPQESGRTVIMIRLPANCSCTDISLLVKHEQSPSYQNLLLLFSATTKSQSKRE